LDSDENKRSLEKKRRKKEVWKPRGGEKKNSCSRATPSNCAGQKGMQQQRRKICAKTKDLKKRARGDCKALLLDVRFGGTELRKLLSA